MRSYFCLVVCALVLASAPGWGKVSLALVSVGVNGFYRQGALTPVVVETGNDGETVKGDLVVRAWGMTQEEGALGGNSYRWPVTLGRRTSKQRRVLGVVISGYAKTVNVAFERGREKVAVAEFTRCQNLGDDERLLAIVGGSGSALSYVNGQKLTLGMEKEAVMRSARAWESVSSSSYYRYGYGYGGGGAVSGTLKTTYLAPEDLPGEGEMLGAASAIMLLSDVTEGALSAEARGALEGWVGEGGHLAIASGGVAARLEAPFFARMLREEGEATVLPAPGGGAAYVRPRGRGFVTLLSFDPEAEESRASDWRKASGFYGWLFERLPRAQAWGSARGTMWNAASFPELKLPSAWLVVWYLFAYVVVLVPLNYLVLWKIDKRELAWVTMPAIVLLFTVGAYAVGVATKGTRLLIGAGTAIETHAGAQSAVAVTELTVFSPARASYRVDGGAGSLVMSSVAGNDDYTSYRGEQTAEQPMAITGGADGLAVERLPVLMWGVRQVRIANRVEMGDGITSALRWDKRARKVVGTVTNGTPYDLQVCMLQCGTKGLAEMVASAAAPAAGKTWAGKTFALKAGETATVGSARTAETTRARNGKAPDELLDEAWRAVRSAGDGSSGAGMWLIAYTTDGGAVPAVRVNEKAPAPAFALIAAKLDPIAQCE